MPGPMSVEAREAFLAEGGRPAVLSVESGGERPPLTVPVWYAYEPGGDLTFFTGTRGRDARKTGLIERAGRLSINVQHPELPYRYVTVEGPVVRTDRPPVADQVTTIVRRYLPGDASEEFAAAELADPSPSFVLFTVRPDRWLTFDLEADASTGTGNDR